MGAACSAGEDNSVKSPKKGNTTGAPSVEALKEPRKGVQKAHSLKHGNSIRIQDHEREAVEEENICASLTNPKFLEKYELVNPEPLGKGAFASVYHIKDIATGEDWALKVVDKNHLSLDAGELQAIRWEAEAQMLCHEPGVVELRESFEVDNGGDLDKGFIYMVMEIMRGGELFDRIMEKVSQFIVATSGCRVCRLYSCWLTRVVVPSCRRAVVSSSSSLPLLPIPPHHTLTLLDLLSLSIFLCPFLFQSKSCYTECDAILVIRSITQALANCHHHQVVHLDLKPENVLYVAETGNPDGESVKICDFGISRTLDPEHPAGGQLVNGQCAPDGRLHGTPGYIAPEMILQLPFDHKCDVWQLGVLAYILISGIPPFEEPQELEGTPEGMEQMFEYIKAGDYFPFDQYQPMNGEQNPWEICSEDAKDFVRKALTPDTSKRPSMKEMLLHPWIENDETRISAARKHELSGVNPRLKKMCAKAKLKRKVRHLIIMNRMNKAATAFAAAPVNMKYGDN
jgi:serine/threonine protein kinase